MNSHATRAILLSTIMVTSVIVVFLGVGIAPAAADEEDPLQPGPISEPGVIEEPGTYTLTSDIDLGGENVTAFEIKASNVVLDGGGHTISNGASEAIHILGQPSLSDVTVRNLKITGVETAISTMNLQDGAFTNLELVSNVDAGLVFAGSQGTGNLVDDVRFADNEKGVFLRQGTSGMTIRNSEFVSNHEVAIKASGSSDNEILDSTFTGQDGEKVIHLTGRSPGHVISGNSITDSTGPEYVIQLGGESANTVVENNVLANNQLGGISVGPNGNTIRNNEIYDHGDNGIAVEGSGNVLQSNTVYDNPVGIQFVGSNNDGSDNVVKNNDQWDVMAVEGATDNSLADTVVDDAGTTVSVVPAAVDFALAGTDAPTPDAPDGYTAIGKYVAVGMTSDVGAADIRLHYTPADLGGATEAALTGALFTDGEWTGIRDAGVVTGSDYVFAQATRGGVVGAVSGTADLNDPIAEAGPNQTVVVGDEVTFDGSASTDNDGVVSYEWDFGDGTNATGETVTHAYDAAGTYTVTLTVTDDAGNTDTDTLTVEVLPVDETDPVADAGPDREVLLGTTVDFDGSGSTDNVGIESYEWDFDDGTNATGATVSHAYASAGTYDVTLTVTDTSGNTATDTATVTVLESDETPPVADAGADRTVEVSTAVSFDGTESTDNIGVTSYEWDFDDGATATGATPSHTFTAEGVYNVTLTVADAAGNTDTDVATITVAEHVDEEVLEPGDIATCGVIEQSGTYTLTTDLVASEEGVTACFEVKASDVVLDGNGHTLLGDTDEAAEAIHVLGKPDPLTNVTVRGFTMTGWESGISAKDVTNSRFVDNHFVSNPDKGIALSGTVSTDNVVENNEFRDNEKGIFLERGASSTDILGNEFVANHESGVKASGATGTLIEDNTFDAHDGEKTIHITGESPNTVIRGNTITNSAGPEYAIHIGGESRATVVEDNVIADNTLGGISAGPFDVTVHNNTVTGNGDIGILVGDGGSTVSENTVTDNRIGIAFDGSANVQAPDNVVRNNLESDVVSLDGATDLTVTGAVVDDAGTTIDVGPSSIDYALSGGAALPAALPGDYTAAGEPVDVEILADGGQVDLTYHYSGVSGTEESQLTLARYDDAMAWWEGVQTTVDSTANTLAATVTEAGVVAPMSGTNDIYPPVASATAEPSVVGVGENVTFDASASADYADGVTASGIVSYEWDFGDGTNATGVNATHAYAASGTYTVTLTVTDAMGYTDTTTLEVGVDAADPVAEAGDDVIVAPGVAATFDGTASTDDVGIETYEWDFGDNESATGATVTHAYADPGTYEVTLTVTDFVGNNATDALTVTVDGEPPVPAVGTEPVEGVAGEPVTFDASASTDNVGIASYEWNFKKGDMATGVTATHTWNEVGNYTVELTVTDLAGNENTTEIDVQIVETRGLYDAIDRDGNGRIGDMEILTAIEYWRTGTEVPDTGGETVGDLAVLDMIEMWRYDEAV